MKILSPIALVGLLVVVIALGAAVPAVAVSASDLLVSSFGSDSILRYDGTTGASQGAFVSAGSGGLDAPRGLTFGPDGNLYVASSATNGVLRYHGTTGAFIDTFVTGGSGGLFLPFALAFGFDSNLYVASAGTNSVLRYDGTTGAFIDVFAASGNPGLSIPNLNTPRGMAFGAGSLFVSGEGDRVWRFDGASGAAQSTFVGDNPRGLAFGPDGNVYFAQNVSDNVNRRNLTTNTTEVFVPFQSINSPLGILFGPDGNLYAASRTDDSVLRFDGGTGAFIDTFVTSGSGGLNDPHFLAFTPAPIPEPGTLLLLGSGLAGLGTAAWRRRRRGSDTASR